MEGNSENDWRGAERKRTMQSSITYRVSVCCVCSWGALCIDLSGSLELAIGHVHTLDGVYDRGGHCALTFQGLWN